MAQQYHKNMSGNNNHSILKQEFANETDRINATGLTLSDIGKIAQQKNNDTFQILKNNIGNIQISLNLLFGITGGTACQGNDGRLSDARNPLSHTHGDVSNDGKIGVTAGVPIITGTGGSLQAGAFGTIAGSFCQGNDSRLSDARTPVDGATFVAGAHGAAATDQVVNVCYGTSTPPAANTTTEGALFIKYTP